MNIYKALGAKPDGEPLKDEELAQLDQWPFVMVIRAPPTARASKADWPPANISAISMPVFCHDKGEWNAIELLNREGPTHGRVF
eukprot:5012961-Pyramimonas_sp.AAC.1